MALLGSDIQKLYHDDSNTSSDDSKLPIFRNSSSAPRLSKEYTNRILIYPGSFNPPHRAHLHLLTHVFNHGCHDLNVIAAVITPSDVDSLRKKIAKKKDTFMFGSSERCTLWEHDPHFPEWAWVFSAQEGGRAQYFKALKEKCASDGYEIEYVLLCGPDCGRPNNPPDGDYGCEMVIMSDAGRRAEYRGRRDDRLKNFKGCTKWRGIKVDEEKVREYVLEHENLLKEALGFSGSPCESCKPKSLESLKARLKEAIEDLKCVIQCQRIINDQVLEIRFVKKKDLDDLAARQIRAICSSKVREIMKAYPQKLQKLESKILSPALVSDHWFSWVGPAKRGFGECVAFPRLSFDVGNKGGLLMEGETPADILLSLEVPPKSISNAALMNSSIFAIAGGNVIEDSLSDTKKMLKRWCDDLGEADESEQPLTKRLRRSNSLNFVIGVEEESWLPVPVKEMGFCKEMP